MLRRLTVCWLAILTTTIGAGCYGTRSLHMNSDSSAAQLGWHIPIKAGDDQRIQQVSAEDEGELVEVTVEEAPQEPSRWKKWFGGFSSSESKAMPLPRTDLRERGTTIDHDAPEHSGLTDF